jgi:hypothetical protein
MGGTTGHAEMQKGCDYDSVCTAIDCELYKLVAFEMLDEAGVQIFVNTLLAGAILEGSRIQSVIVESRSGREAFFAQTFVDCTGYADLSSFAGVQSSEPNDYAVANSIGVGGVSMDGYYEFLSEHDAVGQSCLGTRSGRPDQLVRLDAVFDRLPDAFVTRARSIGMQTVTTSLHDGYFMFLKLNYKMDVGPTDRDAVVRAELELRRRQKEAIHLIREFIPGCEKAFIARTSPSLCIRRGRQITCDYDITLADILDGCHFKDDVLAYGFHDCAPFYKVRDGGTYGVPYRALCVTGLDNLLAAGMMITSDFLAHMSTRNTVCCMGQGQAAGTAAALCAANACTTRALPYSELRQALEAGGVFFEKD